jgi:hypothetical protein
MYTYKPCVSVLTGHHQYIKYSVVTQVNNVIRIEFTIFILCDNLTVSLWQGRNMV